MLCIYGVVFQVVLPIFPAFRDSWVQAKAVQHQPPLRLRFTGGRLFHFGVQRHGMDFLGSRVNDGFRTKKADEPTQTKCCYLELGPRNSWDDHD